jgi:hypothetical protein
VWLLCFCCARILNLMSQGFGPLAVMLDEELRSVRCLFGALMCAVTVRRSGTCHYLSAHSTLALPVPHTCAIRLPPKLCFGVCASCVYEEAVVC